MSRTSSATFVARVRRLANASQSSLIKIEIQTFSDEVSQFAQSLSALRDRSPSAIQDGNQINCIKLQPY